MPRKPLIYAVAQDMHIMQGNLLGYLTTGDTNMTTLESRDYLATDTDITNLAGGMLDGQTATDTIPRQYLRCIVAVTIASLGAPQRLRSGKVTKIKEDEQARQLACLEKTLARFYPLIVARYQGGIPSGPARAKQLNSQTNWARSAATVVRNWIRAGHDLRPVAAVRVTKALLGVTPKARAASPARVKARVEQGSKDLVARVMELATLDKAGAISEIQLLIGQLAGQLEELGVKTTRDAKEAADDHMLLKVGRSLFMPTSTQVLAS